MAMSDGRMNIEEYMLEMQSMMKLWKGIVDIQSEQITELKAEIAKLKEPYRMPDLSEPGKAYVGGPSDKVMRLNTTE